MNPFGLESPMDSEGSNSKLTDSFMSREDTDR